MGGCAIREGLWWHSEWVVDKKSDVFAIACFCAGAGAVSRAGDSCEGSAPFLVGKPAQRFCVRVCVWVGKRFRKEGLVGKHLSCA